MFVWKTIRPLSAPLLPKALRLSLLALVATSLVAACGSKSEAPEEILFERPATYVDYDVTLTGVTDPEVVSLMENALSLYRQREKGAQSLAFLRRRADGDVELAQRILRSFGYYAATVEMTVTRGEGAPGAAAAAQPDDAPPSDEAQTDAASDTAEAEVDAPPAPGAHVLVTVTENKPYTLARHDILLIETGDGPPPELPAAKELGSPVGKTAVARRIVGAETKAVEALKKSGRPYANRKGREAIADPEAAELEVETTIVAGNAYRIGEVTFEGAEGVNRDYLGTYPDWGENALADPARLKAFQTALTATGLFDSAVVRFPEEPPEGDAAPVLVTLEEASPRTVSAGIRYDTDAGPALTGGFEHRNLFGSNETLTLDALLGLEEQSLETRYRIPQWKRPGQDLVFGLDLRRIDDEAFEEIGGTFAGGIERELTDELTVGAGGLVEISRLRDSRGKRTSRLIGLPLFADYDSTDDRLDPTEGTRARLAFTPFAGFIGDTPASFAVTDATLSGYFDFTGSKKYVLALRGRVASILSGDLDIVSANRRLYSGGGGSVRGYGERFLGPLDADGDPTGGLSAVELGAEMRVRVSESLGIAGFVEAGSVSEEIVPVFDDGVQVAVGGGVRYFSPVGPIRFDVGIPLNPRQVDDNFEVYISIGQAF